MKRILAIILTAVLALPLAACSGGDGDKSGLTAIDNSKWLYNSDDKVYYQTGITYCANPADESYETLAIFVPGKFMDAKDNGDGTYTCEISGKGKKNGYTAATAPVVMPVNTPGYSAQAPLTDYTDVSDYMDAGFIYVHAGCRGRDAGAPAGVTDLKAAIRYLRWSGDNIPGDKESIFTFGMSGGGAQSAVVGSSGDSSLYDPYLTAIGAAQDVSDAVLGSMCWCPITNLDTADGAYEWMMGSTRSGLSDDEKEISLKLAESFADYINNAGFRDEDGNLLSLEKSDEELAAEEAGEEGDSADDTDSAAAADGTAASGDGSDDSADDSASAYDLDPTYQSGSYYDYLKKTIETSLNNFLKETEFPYEVQNSAGFGGITLSGTYDTAQDYIDDLNANGKWVKYNAKKNRATITSVADFARAMKTASKGIGAFDQLDAGQGENELFGYGDGKGAHFDVTLAEILNKMNSSYASGYVGDISKLDSAGNSVDIRVDMYTPLYYLLNSEEGYGTATPAKYWRIRSGLFQSDCALSTEVDLALALARNDEVEDVDFATIWGQGHTEAESSGTSTANFINWVNNCMATNN